jgi:hypothetical protein
MKSIPGTCNDLKNIFAEKIAEISDRRILTDPQGSML